jgi:hypothetical protein
MTVRVIHGHATAREARAEMLFRARKLREATMRDYAFVIPRESHAYWKAAALYRECARMLRGVA